MGFSIRRAISSAKEIKGERKDAGGRLHFKGECLLLFYAKTRGGLSIRVVAFVITGRGVTTCVLLGWGRGGVGGWRVFGRSLGGLPRRCFGRRFLRWGSGDRFVGIIGGRLSIGIIGGDFHDIATTPDILGPIENISLVPG